MESYRRININEREEISRLLANRLSFREIAKSIGRSPSSVSREVGRYKDGRKRYRAVGGQVHATRRASGRRKGKRKIAKNTDLFRIIFEKLELFWSPQQIAGYLKINYEDTCMHVSAETIYSYIYVFPRGNLREELIARLRRAHKKRRRKGHSRAGQSSDLADMTSIEERPENVEDRIIPGHWEGDIIIGGARKQTALGTLVERTTRTVILVPLKNKSSIEIRREFAKEIKKLPAQMRLSLTYDQGREMAQHKLFTKQTKMKVYFAHARSPWERGTNENTNGLIRQFFPKGTDFRQVTRKEVKRVQKLLNERPRKTLNWQTPYEAMQKLLR